MRRLLLTPRALPGWLLATGLGLLLLAGPAQAHGDLVDGSPGPGDEVAAGSTALRLDFAAVDTGSRALVAIVDDAGDPVAVGEAGFSGDDTVCARTAALSPGVYTLDYRVSAEDDHPLTGRYQFEVSEDGVAVQSDACDGVDLAEPGEAQTIAAMSGGGVPLWAILGLFLLAAAMGALVVVRIARDRQTPAAD